MTPDSAVTFGYRSPAKWTLILLSGWALLIAAGCLTDWSVGYHVPVIRYVYLLGTVLGVVNRALAVRRAARGLTLDAEGITLHAVPIRLQWSDVREVRILVPEHAKRGVELVVADGVRGVARPGFVRRSKRFRLSGSRLSAPAEEVVAVAERFMAAPSAPGGASGSVDRRPFLVGVAAAVLVVAGFVLQNSFGAAPGFRAAPDSPARLALGNCFDRQKTGTSTTAVVLPCAAPHDGEVYAVIHLSGGIAALWGGVPSTATIASDAKSGCTVRFLTALEPDMLGRSDLAARIFVPGRGTWPAGNRKAICFLVSRQGKITGSLLTDTSPADPMPTVAASPVGIPPLVLPSPKGAPVSMSVALADYTAAVSRITPLDTEMATVDGQAAERAVALKMFTAKTNEAIELARTAWPARVRAPMARFVQDVVASRQAWGTAAHATSDLDMANDIVAATKLDADQPVQTAVDAALQG